MVVGVEEVGLFSLIIILFVLASTGFGLRLFVRVRRVIVPPVFGRRSVRCLYERVFVVGTGLCS